MLLRQSEDRVLRALRVAALGGARGADERVGGARGGRHNDDALPPRPFDDLGDALQRGGRRDGRPAEFQNGPHYVACRAIWITSPSIADAVASPPAPGPLHTRRGTRSLSSVITFVGPVACPSSESAATSSGPTRALVAFSPKSATARKRTRAPRAAAPVRSDAAMPRRLVRRTLSGWKCRPSRIETRMESLYAASCPSTSFVGSASA